MGQAISWTAVATGTLLIGMFLAYRNLVGFSAAVPMALAQMA